MKSLRKSLKKAVSIGVAMVCLLTCIPVMNGCGNKKTAGVDANGDKVLRFGVATPLTGDSAKAGQEFRDAAQVALEEAGYKAGGYKLEVTYVDVTNDPEKATLALEQSIVKDKLDAVILNWNSSCAVAMMDVVAKYKIPYFFGLGATTAIDEKIASDPEKYSYYICKGWASPQNLTESYYLFIKELIEKGEFNPRNKKFATYNDDTDFGHVFGPSTIKNFESIGWECVYEDYFALNTTDMYAAITKIKESDASLFVGCFNNPASSAAFLKQAKELNLNCLIVCDSITENADWYELTGETSDYIFDSRPKLTSEKALKFVDTFKEKYGYEPSATAGGQVYDYTRFFVDIVAATEEKYGEANSETLYQFGREVLMKGGIEFTDGVMCDCYKYDEESDPNPIVKEGYYIYPMLQLIDGEMKVVWPENVKETDAVIPDYAK